MDEYKGMDEYKSVPDRYLSDDSPLGEQAKPQPRLPKKAPRSTLRDMQRAARAEIDGFRPFGATPETTGALHEKIRLTAPDPVEVAFRPKVGCPDVTPRRVRPLSPHELYALQVKAVKEAFEEEDFTFADLEPCRIFVAWRLVRELAYLFNALGNEQRLDDVLPSRVTGAGVAADPFHDNRTVPLRPLSRGLHAYAAIRRAPDGIPLLPPNDAETARYYAEALNAISDYLRIRDGSPKHLNVGRYGIAGLLAEDTVHAVFPQLSDLLEFEEALIEQTRRWLVKFGSAGARSNLQHTYGLRRIEIVGLLKLARSFAREELLGSDIEDERAIMLQRLESAAARARKSFNLREEMNAMKQIAQIHGFTRQEPEDLNNDFFNVVKKVSDERKAKTIDAPAARQITTDGFVTIEHEGDTPAE